MSLRRIILSAILISIIATIFFFMHRLSVMHSPASARKINVVTTTSMITDAVKRIGGEKVQVHGLMGPGVDPHLYRARAGDMYKLASADIIFYNGLHLEGKMVKIFEQMQQRTTTVAITKKIPIDRLLNSEFAGMYDPHIWFDVSLWKKVIKVIRDTLIDKDSKNTTHYQKRTQSYLHELNMLDRYVKTQVNLIPKHRRILVTAHDAFAYFGKAYGFNVIGLQGISTDSEIGTKDVQDLVNFIVIHKVPSVFVESSVPHRTIQAVQQAAQAQGWPVSLGDELYSDALGAPDSQVGTYIGMIRHDIDTIVEALQ